MNLYQVVFKELDDVFVVATDLIGALIKADTFYEGKGHSLSARALKDVELIASEDGATSTMLRL